jgi:hypothetical protein
MKATFHTLALLTLFFSLVGTGCYTQIGSTRDDRFSGEYQQEPSITEESPAVDDSATVTATETTDPYFDENGYPRDRFYFDVPTPLWAGVNYGWYDPWYYRPWYNDMFWCWNPGIAYYSPWWYPTPWYYPTAGWYGGDYHTNSRYASTRSIGNTRGSGGGRGTMGSPRGGYEPAGRSAPASMDLPAGMRQAPTPGQARPGAVTTAREREKVRSTVPGRETVRGGSGSRPREAVRPAPRRPSRGTTAPAPPTYNPGTGSTSGGTRSGVSTPPPAPAPRPSGTESGTRGSGSTRGGGGGRR